MSLANRNTTQKGGNKNGGTNLPKSLPLVGIVMAIVLVIAYLVAIYFLWPMTAPTTQDAQWLRLLDLRGGLEALAFAAAGALFGTTVQRQATNQAERTAEREEERADRNERAAQGGVALSAAVRSLRASGAVGTQAAPDPLAGLEEIATQFGL